MRAAELKEMLRKEPFEPLCVGLSDGRSVVIHHPDQVVISERYLYVGLAKVKRSAPLATPKSSEAIPRDFIWVNLLHVVTVEPDGSAVRASTRRRRKKKK